MSIDQPQIVGFIEVDKVIELGYLTKWSTYKVFQAVRNNDLEYREVHYLQHDSTLLEAIDLFDQKKARFAVVRKYPKEIGMISKNAV